MTPIFNCTFTKSNKCESSYTGQVTFDSGACLSVMHEQMLLQCEYEITGNRLREYSGAGGNRLPLLDYVVDVKVHVDQIGWIILRSVLVLRKEAKLTTTVLMGRYDLQRLKIVMDFRRGKVIVHQGKSDQKSVQMPRRQSNAVARVKKSKQSKLVAIKANRTV